MARPTIHQTYVDSEAARSTTAVSIPILTRFGICTCTTRPMNDSASEVISSARCALTIGNARRSQGLRTSGSMDAFGARRLNDASCGEAVIVSLANDTSAAAARECPLAHTERGRDHAGTRRPGGRRPRGDQVGVH